VKMNGIRYLGGPRIRTRGAKRSRAKMATPFRTKPYVGIVHPGIIQAD